MNKSKQFYVYLHSVPEIGVFYVGKGDEARCKLIARPHNPHHTKICMKYGTDNIAVTLIPCSSEQSALELETSMIISMRKAGVKLVNQTSGNASVENEQIKELAQRLETMERQIVQNTVITREKIIYVEKPEKQRDVYSEVLRVMKRFQHDGITASRLSDLCRTFKKLQKHQKNEVLNNLAARGEVVVVKDKQVSGQTKQRYIVACFA